MIYLIKIKKSTFNVSKSIVSVIIKNNLNFKVFNHKEKQTYPRNALHSTRYSNYTEKDKEREGKKKSKIINE